MADDETALSLDRNWRSEHVDRVPLDHLSCMASVDSAHAFEEEVGLCSLFQPPLPVSQLAVPVGALAEILGR